MTLIETHAHLDYPDFASDFDDVLRRATDAGVTRIITIGTSIESSRRAVELAEEYSNIFAVIGVHPTYANEAATTWSHRCANWQKIRAWSQSVKPVSIIIICRAWKRGSKKMCKYLMRCRAKPEEQVEASMEDGAYKSKQAELFQEQLDLAVELGLNVVIHQRDAWDDTLEVMQAYTGKLRGVFHCFGGSFDQANEVIDLGHLVSFTGIVTFKNGKEVREVAAQIPLGKFMVETDCPYLAPVPFRGKRCEPAYTRLVAEEIARARVSPFRRNRSRDNRNCGTILSIQMMAHQGGSSSLLLDAKNNVPSAPDITSPAERAIHLYFIFLALALFLVSCAAPRDEASRVVVSVRDQKLALVENGNLVATYPISTSKFGMGDWRGSYRTPLGKLEIADKIGDGAPLGAVFKDRRRTGEVVGVNAPGRDPIVTRIIWLRGREAQNANAFARDIYIHGTPEERNIGRPASYGCIRMRSVDIVQSLQCDRVRGRGFDRKRSFGNAGAGTATQTGVGCSLAGGSSRSNLALTVIICA